MANLCGRRCLNLHAHDLAEAALSQLFLNRRKEVIRLALLNLDVCVSCDAEGICTSNFMPNKEQFYVRTDQVLQEDGATVTNLHQPPQDLGHFDAREEAFASLRIVQLHGEREAEATDIREGVSRVNSEWCEHWEDLLLEARCEFLLRCTINLFPLNQGETSV